MYLVVSHPLRFLVSEGWEHIDILKQFHPDEQGDTDIFVNFHSTIPADIEKWLVVFCKKIFRGRF